MIVECNFAGARFALHRADGTISYFVTRADAERAEAAAEAECKATPPADYPFCKAVPCPHWRGYCTRDPACND